ncbi:hypothetical protein ACFQBY_15105 [Promicromonospora citrea]|nr:hypothetical protein [Promicromonospora citrea]NNH51835.1 hypothetical protein [Promicromonospora citrea]
MPDTAAIEIAVRLASRVGTPVADAEVDGAMVRQTVRLGDDEIPVELLLDARGMDPLIRSRQADARDVFPDVDENEGALRVAAENLMATIVAGPAFRAGVDQHGRIWRSDVSDPPTSDALEGNFRWESGG